MRASAAEDEASVRRDLAATYNLLHRLGLNEGACNHLSALVPGTRDRFLLNRYGLLWSEVTPQNLVLVDSQGGIVAGRGPVETTAFQIHRAVHLADPVRNAVVLHTHMPYATALCCTTSRGRSACLQMCHQNSLRFFGDWAYDDEFHGLVTDQREGDRLAAALRGARVLLAASHGVIVCGRTVAEACIAEIQI